MKFCKRCGFYHRDVNRGLWIDESILEVDPVEESRVHDQGLTKLLISDTTKDQENDTKA